MKILFSLFLFIPFIGLAQPVLPKGVPSPKSNGYSEIGYYRADSAFLVGTRDTNFTPVAGVTAMVFAHDSLYYYSVSQTKWIALGTGSSSQIPGGPITSLPAVADNPGTNIPVSTFIINEFYKNQSPTATLTGGAIIDYTSAGSTAKTLNWSAGRQFATNPLSSIVVAGVGQSFSQPSAPGTVSGTQSVNVPANTTTTYQNVVTTTDGKTATASTTFTSELRIYAGFVSSTTPTSADIIAATGSSYVGGEFATSRNQSGSLSTPSGSKYVMFCNPVSFGVPNITINGLGVTYNITTITFVGPLGYSSSYYLAIAPFPTSGPISSYLVN